MPRSTTAGGATNEGRARNRARFNSESKESQYHRLGLRTYEELADQLDHVGDIEARVQSVQLNSMSVILTMNVPLAAARAVTEVHMLQGAYLMFRVYTVPPPRFTQDQDPEPDSEPERSKAPIALDPDDGPEIVTLGG